MQQVVLTGEQFSQLVRGKAVIVTPPQGDSVSVTLTPMAYGIMMNYIQEAIEATDVDSSSCAEQPESFRNSSPRKETDS